VLFVTATNTNIGKTKACEILIHKYLKDGLKVAYFKPIETGVVANKGDANRILKILNKHYKHQLTIEDISGYRFALAAAPAVANTQNIIIDTNWLLNKTAKLLNDYDIVVVEGAGGLKTPITDDIFVIDLIHAFQTYFHSFETLLITGSYLGCISDTLLSLDCLKSYGIRHRWFVNLYQDKDTFHHITEPFYRRYFKHINYLQDI
jgi:dethiobiotin synthetase